ncbi:hypothetical protein, partial [Corynebacterium glucuronolyticum]
YADNNFNQVGFFPTPEEQDAFPRTVGLFTNLAPTYFSGARKGLACSLAYLTSVSGSLSFNSKLSPLTASLLQQLLPSREIFIDTACIEFKPIDMQLGQSTMHVKAVDSLTEAANFSYHLGRQDSFGQTTLAVLKNDGVSGFISMPRRRIVASNLWMSSELEYPLDTFLKTCSIALMYSEDLVANRIVLHNQADGVSKRDINLITELFYSVGISLEIK